MSKTKSVTQLQVRPDTAVSESVTEVAVRVPDSGQSVTVTSSATTASGAHRLD